MRPRGCVDLATRFCSGAPHSSGELFVASIAPSSTTISRDDFFVETLGASA
jgi:hypothetical protein